MENPADKININLNQNLWGLLVGFGFLGVSEYYNLCVSLIFATILSVIMLISICFTTFAYTVNYMNKKNGG